MARSVILAPPISCCGSTVWETIQATWSLVVQPPALTWPMHRRTCDE